MLAPIKISSDFFKYPKSSDCSIKKNSLVDVVNKNTIFEHSLLNLALINFCSIKSFDNKNLVDENVSLIEGCSKHYLSDISDIDLDKMVFVHATNYFPKEGIIKSTANATKEKTGYFSPRFKIHGSINHFVEEHSSGSWNNKNYAIIMPFNKLVEANDKKNFLGGELVDFFIRGNIKIPEGSFIIKTNSYNIPKGKIKISNYYDDKKIKVIETPRNDISNFTNEIIKKIGYSLIDWHYILHTYEGTMYRKNTKQAWKNLTDKYGFERTRHSFSPWGKSEIIFDLIYALKNTSDSWIEKNKDGFSKYSIDYQKEILQIIQDIKFGLKNSETLDYDIDKLYNIVTFSSTPSEAIEKIKKELNIVNYYGTQTSFSKENENSFFDNVRYYAKKHLLISNEKAIQELIRRHCSEALEKLFE